MDCFPIKWVQLSENRGVCISIELSMVFQHDHNLGVLSLTNLHDLLQG